MSPRGKETLQYNAHPPSQIKQLQSSSLRSASKSGMFHPLLLLLLLLLLSSPSITTCWHTHTHVHTHTHTHTHTDLSARCPSGIDSAPDVTDLLNTVVPHIQGHLSEVGLQLGLTQEAIDAIATDPSSSQHWTKVFSEWKERAVKPYTWATLLGVMESSALGCEQQAQGLRARITGGGVVTRERASSSVSKTDVDAASGGGGSLNASAVV